MVAGSSRRGSCAQNKPADLSRDHSGSFDERKKDGIVREYLREDNNPLDYSGSK